VAAFCLAALLGVGLCLAARAGASGPVYGVATLRAQLAREGSAWLGRTVRVRAALDPCGGTSLPGGRPCPTFAPALVDSAGGSTAGPLPLQLGPAPQPLALFRRIPLLDRLLPGPQALHWGEVAVYQVRLVGCGMPDQPACYVAVLLDAAPIPVSPAQQSGWPGGHHAGGLIPSTN
jgi:hypothetical protein